MKKLLFSCIAAVMLLGFVASVKADFYGYTPVEGDYIFQVTGRLNYENNGMGSRTPLDFNPDLPIYIAVNTNDAGNGALFTMFTTDFDLKGMYVQSNHPWEIFGYEDGAFASKTIFSGQKHEPIGKTYEKLFVEGYTWPEFANSLMAGEVTMWAHTSDGWPDGVSGGGPSIQMAIFDYLGRHGGDTDLFGDDPTPPNPTPEPATMLVMGLGVLGAGFAARRRRSA